MNVGTPFWVAVPLALGDRAARGRLQRRMIAHVGMPPFVVTLGMLSIARSLAMVLSNNRMVYEFGPDQAQLLALGGGFISVAVPFREAIRVPNPVVFLIAMALPPAGPSGGRSGAGTSSPSAATRRRRTSPACRSGA